MISFLRELRAVLAAVAVASCTAASAPWSDPERGLLASPGLEGQPVKAVYFFPGEREDPSLDTIQPLDPRDGEWNSNHSTRAWVLERMVDANVNTVVMSYWGPAGSSMAQQDSPMAIDATSVSGVLDAAAGRPVVILPALESGCSRVNPSCTDSEWNFASEFPTDDQGRPAPGLVERIGDMVDLFRGRMNLWAQMYDREGTARYAVNILAAYSTQLRPMPGDLSADLAFASGFDAVAAQVEQTSGVRVGFTLDPSTFQGEPYVPNPAATGPALEATPSVLAIQSFEPEIFSGVVRFSPPGAAPYDNNADNLGPIADWKQTNTSAWVGTGVPVLLSVSNGYDARFVWGWTGFWGDNHDATDDRFRNWMSEAKGNGVKGITFDTWNGYTEGYVAVPSVEHEGTVYSWLTDLLRPDPRHCDHVHYASGAPTYRVHGSICAKWVRLGADRRFGAPTSDELPSARGRVTHFTRGSIYWSLPTHAHEVHGAIAKAYRHVGADASCLGLPVHDEEAVDGARMSRFEHGRIVWKRGGPRAQILCDAAPGDGAHG